MVLPADPLGSAAHPGFDLPSSTRIVELSLQSAAAVDDVNSVTSDEGRIFVQAKRSVTLSKAANSPLGSAIDQFVRQHKIGVAINRPDSTITRAAWPAFQAAARAEPFLVPGIIAE